MAKEAEKKKPLSPAWWIAYGVVCGLGASGLVLLLSSRPRGKPIELVPAATIVFREVISDPLPSPTPTSEPTPTVAFPININTATIEELQNLPNVGPVLASAIVNYRDSHGPFTEVEQLMNVSGVGQRTFDGLQPLITLGEIGNATPTPS
ncbi:MAG: ComEA family DNA-binding protein [Anaerolineales bacterium]